MMKCSVYAVRLRTLSLFGLLLGSTLHAEDDPHLRQAWQRSREPLLKVMELESERRDLPEARWIRRDQRRLDADINKQLDSIIAILSVTGLTQIRAEYGVLEERILNTRERIRDLRERRITAPLEKGRLEFFRQTRDELTADIEALEENIRELEAEKEQKVNALRREYAEMGLEISDEQIRFHLSTVSGTDLMQISALFHNVRELNRQLETLMRENPGDALAARRYYGMHVAMIRTTLRAHEVAMQNINERYLPRIEVLKTRNEQLRTETEAMLRLAPREDRAILRSSYRTQQITHEALETYQAHLQDVHAQMYEASKTLKQRLQVAQNAYETIQISTTLITEMQAAVNDITAIRDMHLPALQPIQDDAVRRKFDEISEALRAE